MNYSKYRLLLVIILIISIEGYSQQHELAQFAFWQPNDRLQFENGYKKHLEWHRNNDDTWGWWGWFVISGPRYGQFADATFHRTWKDFDNAVKPAEDLADNRLHVFPFGDVTSIFKIKHYPTHSTNDTLDYKARLTRLITLSVNDASEGLRAIQALKKRLTDKGVGSFHTFSMVDGGSLYEFVILIGARNWQEFGLSDSVAEDLDAIEDQFKLRTITSVVSETLVYRPDLSLFPTH